MKPHGVAPDGLRLATWDQAPVARLERRQPLPVSFNLLFDALADPERLRLLAKLEHFPAAAGRLGRRLGWTRDATAKQLHLLKRAGLVRGEAANHRVEYRLVGARLDQPRLWLAELWFSASPLGLDTASALDADQQAALAAALRTAGRRRLLEDCVEEVGWRRARPVVVGPAWRPCPSQAGAA